MKGYYQKILENASPGTTHVDLKMCRQAIHMSNPYLTFCYRKTVNEWYYKKGDQKHWTMMKSEPEVKLLSLDSVRILSRQFPDSHIEGLN